jgi:hypothetical protein
VAAFAALLSDDVDTVTLRNALPSYHELTQVPVFRWPLSHLVRGILCELDLPDIYRALSDKRLRMVDPWDARMKRRKGAPRRRGR